MDGSRFDILARAIAQSGTRRRLVSLLLALPLGGVLASAAEDAAAAERPHERLLGRTPQRNRKQRNTKKNNNKNNNNQNNNNKKNNKNGGGGRRSAAPCLSNGNLCTQDSDCCSSNCFNFVCAERVTQCSQGGTSQAMRAARQGLCRRRLLLRVGRLRHHLLRTARQPVQPVRGVLCPQLCRVGSAARMAAGRGAPARRDARGAKPAPRPGSVRVRRPARRTAPMAAAMRPGIASPGTPSRRVARAARPARRARARQPARPRRAPTASVAPPATTTRPPVRAAAARVGSTASLMDAARGSMIHVPPTANAARSRGRPVRRSEPDDFAVA